MKSKGFSYLESSSIHGAKGTMITHSKTESIIYSSSRGLLQCFSFGQVTDFTMFLFHIFFFSLIGVGFFPSVLYICRREVDGTVIQDLLRAVPWALSMSAL